MAYMDQEIKSKIAVQEAPLLKKYGLKGTFKTEKRAITLVLRSGIVDFGPRDASFRGDETARENKWGSDEIKLQALEILSELDTAMRLPSYFDKTDTYSDYFHTSYYYYVQVGEWNKGYILTA